MRCISQKFQLLVKDTKQHVPIQFTGNLSRMPVDAIGLLARLFSSGPYCIGEHLHNLLGVLPTNTSVRDRDAVFEASLAFCGYFLCACYNVSLILYVIQDDFFYLR